MMVAVYIRVSTLDQAREGYSLAAQQKSLEEWCTANGHCIYCVYNDPGISGKDIAHRPAMRQMLDDIKSGQIDLVLVWALSRLTRSVADLYDTYNLLQRYGCNIRSYTEPFDTATPMGRAMMGICGVFAQMERELTAERVRAAMAERAAQGKRTCNEILGYDLDGSDSLKINEAEAQIVQYIFDKYLEYRSLSAVAELCRVLGYHGKRGRIFKAQHIKVILSRPIYVGYNSFKGELHKGMFEPIIQQKTWDDVQRILSAPKNVGRKRKVSQ